MSAYFSHKPRATIHLVEVQCSEESVELHEGCVEVGSDEFQVRCLVAKLASLTLTISVTVRRLFSLGRRLASLLLQAALLCLLLAFLMPLLLDDGVFNKRSMKELCAPTPCKALPAEIKWSRTSGGVRSSNNVTSIKPPIQRGQHLVVAPERVWPLLFHVFLEVCVGGVEGLDQGGSADEVENRHLPTAIVREGVGHCHRLRCGTPSLIPCSTMNALYSSTAGS